MKIPDWAPIVKLAKYNELAPYDDDWYYTRAGKFFVLKKINMTFIYVYIDFQFNLYLMLFIINMKSFKIGFQASILLRPLR